MAGRPRLNRAKSARNASSLNERGRATEMPEPRQTGTNAAAVRVGVGMARERQREWERGREGGNL